MSKDGVVTQVDTLSGIQAQPEVFLGQTMDGITLHYLGQAVRNWFLKRSPWVLALDWGPEVSRTLQEKVLYTDGDGEQRVKGFITIFIFPGEYSSRPGNSSLYSHGLSSVRRDFFPLRDDTFSMAWKYGRILFKEQLLGNLEIAFPQRKAPSSSASRQVLDLLPMPTKVHLAILDTEGRFATVGSEASARLPCYSLPSDTPPEEISVHINTWMEEYSDRTPTRYAENTGFSTVLRDDQGTEVRHVLYVLGAKDHVRSIWHSNPDAPDLAPCFRWRLFHSMRSQLGEDAWGGFLFRNVLESVIHRSMGRNPAYPDSGNQYTGREYLQEEKWSRIERPPPVDPRPLGQPVMGPLDPRVHAPDNDLPTERCLYVLHLLMDREGLVLIKSNPNHCSPQDGTSGLSLPFAVLELGAIYPHDTRPPPLPTPKALNGLLRNATDGHYEEYPGKDKAAAMCSAVERFGPDWVMGVAFPLGSWEPTALNGMAAGTWIALSEFMELPGSVLFRGTHLITTLLTSLHEYACENWRCNRARTVRSLRQEEEYNHTLRNAILRTRAAHQQFTASASSSAPLGVPSADAGGVTKRCPAPMFTAPPHSNAPSRGGSDNVGGGSRSNPGQQRPLAHSAPPGASSHPLPPTDVPYPSSPLAWGTTFQDPPYQEGSGGSGGSLRRCSHIEDVSMASLYMEPKGTFQERYPPKEPLKVACPRIFTVGACIHFRESVARAQSTSSRSVNYMASLTDILGHMVKQINANPMRHHFLDGQLGLIRDFKVGTKTKGCQQTPFTANNITSQPSETLVHLLHALSAPLNKRDSAFAFFQSCFLNLEDETLRDALTTFFSAGETVLLFLYQLLFKTPDEVVRSQAAGELFPNMHKDQDPEESLGRVLQAMLETQMPEALYAKYEFRESFKELERARNRGEFSEIGPLVAYKLMTEYLVRTVDCEVTRNNTGMRDPKAITAKAMTPHTAAYALSPAEEAMAKAAQKWYGGTAKANTDTAPGSRRAATLSSLEESQASAHHNQLDDIVARQGDLVNQMASLCATTKTQQLSLILAQNGYDNAGAQTLCSILTALEAHRVARPGAERLHEGLMLAVHTPTRTIPLLCFSGLWYGKCNNSRCGMAHAGQVGFPEAAQEWSRIILDAALNVKDTEAQAAIRRVHGITEDGLRRADSAGRLAGQSPHRAQESDRFQPERRDQRADSRATSQGQRSSGDSRYEHRPSATRDSQRDDRYRGNQREPQGNARNDTRDSQRNDRYRGNQQEPQSNARSDTPSSRDRQSGRLEAQSPTNAGGGRTDSTRERQETRPNPAPARPTTDPNPRGGTDSSPRVQFTSQRPSSSNDPRPFPRSERYPPGGGEDIRGAGGGRQAERQFHRTPGGGLNNVSDQPPSDEQEEEERHSDSDQGGESDFEDN